MKRARPLKGVDECAAEITAWLPKLSERHTPLVLVAALTEHVGGALFLSKKSEEMSPDRARAIIRRMKEIAFNESY